MQNADGAVDSDAASCDGCADAGADTVLPDLLDPPNFDPGPCSVDGWCWVMPEAQANALNGIWGSSAADIYAVGDAFTIVHFDGSRWEIVAAGLPAGKSRLSYRAVWGFSASDLFVGGDEGALLHFDGKRWRSHGAWPQGSLPGSVHGLWGSSRTALFAVGDGGVILRFDGTAWSERQSPTQNTLLDVWGFSASEVLAVGEHGTIVRLEGSSWQVMDAGTQEQINAVWGVAASDVFVGTEQGSILRFDGSAWSKVHQAPGHIDAIWGESATSIAFGGWQGVLHYDGTSFRPRLDSHSVNGLWGSPGAALHAAGPWGVIHREEGGTFTQQAGAGEAFDDVWAQSATEVYLVSSGKLLRWDGSALTTARNFDDFPQRICGHANGALVVLGSQRTHRRDATTGEWKERATAMPLNGLWCSPTSEHAVAVGWSGSVERFDTTQWYSEGTGSAEHLEAVWGSSPTNILAVGRGAQIARYDGSAWTLLQNTGVSGQLSGITGRSATDIFILSDTKIHRFDGTRSVGGQSIGLFARVLAGSGESFFAGTDFSGFYRLAGTQWVAEAIPVARAVDAVSVSGGSAWAVGIGGSFLRRALP